MESKDMIWKLQLLHKHVLWKPSKFDIITLTE